MKKTIIIFLVLFTISIESCDLVSKGGLLYITDQTNSEAELYMVKILERTYSSSSQKNIFSDYKEKISYGGYTWYVYDIPAGSWDIYLEYKLPADDYNNEREGVFIEGGSSGNEWAAIWLTELSSGDSYTAEQGGGELNITSSKFN